MKQWVQNTLVLKIIVLVLSMLIPFTWFWKPAEPGCVLFLRRQNMMSIMSTNPYGLAARCLPRRRDLWEQAARQASEIGDFGQAAAYLERLSEEAALFGTSPEKALSEDSLELLANAYRQQGDLGSSVETMLKIAKKRGLDAGLAEEIASLFLAMDDHASAVQTWKELLGAEPDNPRANYQVGLLLAAMDPESALPYLEKAARLSPGLSDTAEVLYQAIGSAGISSDRAYQLVIAGRSLAAAREWGLATDAFRQATVLNPGYAEAWAFLGEALQHAPAAETPDGQAGLRELQKADALDPGSLAAHTLLALFHQRNGDSEAALMEIERSLEISPNSPVLVSQRASLLASSGKLDEAFAEYEHAASLALHDPAYLRQVVVFSLAYNYKVDQTALPLADQLLTQAPDSAVDLDLMAQVLIQMGDLESAENFLSRALQFDPGCASAYLHLGLISILHEDPENASEFLQAAIRLDPDGTIAEQARRLLEGGSP
jgi:tetratricopeptide (TPR) repeat protein